MKRFWLVMLTLGLIVAFSTTVFAADVKFSGKFEVGGMYVDKTSLIDDVGPSTAFYFQRLRVQTEFIVSPALKLVTRFDAMERIWGGTRSATGTGLDIDSSGTRAENENIAFDWAYINYKSKIGTFDVGIMNDGSTGTIFANSYGPTARIKYSNNFGPVKVGLAYTKIKEGDVTAVNLTGVTDADDDKYGVVVEYGWKGGKAGLNVNYYNYASARPASNYKRKYLLFTPYAIAKIGPVALQTEVNYLTGDQDYDNGTSDIDLRGISAFIDATANFGMFYAGGSIAYVSGDDPGTSSKNEGYSVSGGRDWNPCLILFGYYDTQRWVGPIRGHHASSTGDVNNVMKNAFFYQGRVGVRPIADLDIMASLAYATADKKPSGYLEKDYGIEFDLTATYKITNNLSYMLGAGYLWTGDYFKYNNSANKVDDNFMVINKLTLTF
ncbi:MAG: hypothetical protein JW914_04595 [Syntrophaceae bacterium]|nr:hypothetical protein [Syntrophaceae bacterium]